MAKIHYVHSQIDEHHHGKHSGGTRNGTAQVLFKVGGLPQDKIAGQNIKGDGGKAGNRLHIGSDGESAGSDTDKKRQKDAKNIDRVKVGMIT